MATSKSLNFLIIIFFVCSLVTPVPKAHANALLGLPEPGTMVDLSPAYEPVLIKGLKVHPENPFLFDFIIDTGDDSVIASEAKSSLIKEYSKLIKYFLAAMTVPEKDLWVNLSPYEKNRMIASNLAQTEMGRDMLAQDYILKQLTASLIYPERNLGKTFWNEVYAKARELYGTTQVPVNTFNKVWIVADKADVYERDNIAYVAGAHLKVMLEEDYLATQKHRSQHGHAVILSAGPHTGHSQVAPKDLDRINSLRDPSAAPQNDESSLASQIVRQIILPQLEREVNSGKNFAPLRQMFYSMILASWYKMSLKNALLTQIYGNQSKVKVGINQADTKVNEAIFNRYLRAYKKGVFNFIKDDLDQANGETIPRKYFSGGEDMEMLQHVVRQVSSIDPAMLEASGHDFMATVNAYPAGFHRVKQLFPSMQSIEAPEDVRVIIPGDQVHPFREWFESGTDRENFYEAIMREAREEFAGEGSSANLFEALPRSLQDERGLKISRVVRIIGTRRLRDSTIVFTPLTHEESEQAIARIRAYPNTHAVALSEETVALEMEKIKKASGKGDVAIGLNNLKDIFPLGYQNEKFSFSGNVIELSNNTRFSLNGQFNSESRVRLKYGVFFNMPLFVKGKKYYLFELDPLEGSIKPFGGGIQFKDGAMTTGDRAMLHQANAARATSLSPVNGGIDFNARNMQINVHKNGRGVAMHFDPAIIARIKREDFDGLEFHIQSIVPVTNLPVLLGLESAQNERLVLN